MGKLWLSIAIHRKAAIALGIKRAGPVIYRSGHVQERLAATSTAARVAAATVIVVDQQEDDDNEQDPGAVIAAKQVSQTHIFSPPFLAYTPYYVPAQTGVPNSFIGEDGSFFFYACFGESSRTKGVFF